MARPVVGDFTEQIYSALEPLAYTDESLDWHLLKYLESIGATWQDIEDLIRDTDARIGWGKLVDLALTPRAALPWLGQFVGVPVIEGLTEQQERDSISDKAGFRRGSPAAMIAAAQLYLTGNKTVLLYERDSSAYHMSVVTYLSETPGEDVPSTNGILNGGFETNLTGWTPDYGDVTRVPGAKFGASCAKIVDTDNLGITYFYNNQYAGAPIPQVPHSASVWVKAEGSMIGRNVGIWLTEAGGAQGQNMIGASLQYPLTGDWQRIKVENRTPVESDRTSLILYLSGYSQFAGYTWYVDGAQIEENAFATPYIETDGAPASRLAGEGPVGRALFSQKPAGIILEYSVLSGQSWGNLEANHADWAAVDADYATWDDVRTDT